MRDWQGQIGAVLFDMDGTLVDSEPLTEQAVSALLEPLGVAAHGIDPRRFHGVTWASIAGMLISAHPKLRDTCTSAALQHIFHGLWQAHPPEFIPGAREALEAAHQGMRTSIVTSSQRATAESLVAGRDLGPLLDATICAEDVERSKPDPDAFLKAASRLGVDPGHCLVFEDSLAGLQAARSAGMRSIAITHRCDDTAPYEALADATIRDYTALPTDFFTSIRCPSAEGQ
jgi:HAD superfamily hydrolase (TIGR01509 family)